MDGSRAIESGDGVLTIEEEEEEKESQRQPSTSTVAAETAPAPRREKNTHAGARIVMKTYRSCGR